MDVGKSEQEVPDERLSDENPAGHRRIERGGHGGRGGRRALQAERLGDTRGLRVAGAGATYRPPPLLGRDAGVPYRGGREGGREVSKGKGGADRGGRREGGRDPPEKRGAGQ